MIELESCIYLKHSRCWDPSAKLETKRELGVGLGQITKAYKADGTVRFDALAELKFKHKKELEEVTWQNIQTRPDLQIRAVVLKMQDNYKYYNKYASNTDEALAFSDAAYNGGIGGLDNERRACKLASWCDHTKWYGNVEKLCLKSNVALYGKRSPCQINREHTEQVMLVRANKYKKFWQN